jgi:hypothetical protein
MSECAKPDLVCAWTFAFSSGFVVMCVWTVDVSDALADARQEALQSGLAQGGAEDDAVDDDQIESFEGDPDDEGQDDAGHGRVRRVAENLRNVEMSDEEALEAHLTNRGRRRMARALQVHLDCCTNLVFFALNVHRCR